MAKRLSKKKTTRKVKEKKENEDWALEITQTQSDVKSFLEKFKTDVARKTKEYREYAQESQKKKKL